MAKRATIYFEEPTHKALRLKAAETDRSISDLVNDSVTRALAEDADDLAIFRESAEEPALPFVTLPSDLAQAVEGEARRRRVPVSRVIREGIEEHLGRGAVREIPFAAIGRSGQTDVSENIEAILDDEWGRANRR